MNLRGVGAIYDGCMDCNLMESLWRVYGESMDGAALRDGVTDLRTLFWKQRGRFLRGVGAADDGRIWGDTLDGGLREKRSGVSV